MGLRLTMQTQAFSSLINFVKTSEQSFDLNQSCRALVDVLAYSLVCLHCVINSLYSCVGLQTLIILLCDLLYIDFFLWHIDTTGAGLHQTTLC